MTKKETPHVSAGRRSFNFRLTEIDFYDMLSFGSFVLSKEEAAVGNDEEQQKFESDLRRKRPDLVGNPQGVREVIRWFDGQIAGIESKFKHFETYAKDFLHHRNQLARYIGDQEKSFDDYKTPGSSRS